MPAVTQAIVARRKQRAFADLADLITDRGTDATSLNAKTRLIFFR